MAETLTMMAVHAHPDDEASSTGGVLAAYSAQGIRTVVVTCTLGNLGEVTAEPEVAESLRDFADAEGLTERGVHMLAAINFRGQQPVGRDSWALVWQAIKASVRTN